MSTIVTRSGKGSPLTHNEVDANFNNLNSDKAEKSNNLSDLTSASTARTNLGLVASATTDTTNASNISSGTLDAARLPALVGDASSSAGSNTLTLATVNSTTGSFGSATSIPVVTVNGKGLVTSVTTATVQGGQKNRIINGAMVISQRNGTASVTPGTFPAYLTDRFAYNASVASKLSFQQVTDAPSGFNNSLKVTVAAQYSPAAGERFILYQKIEGFNVANLQFGTAGALTITTTQYIKGSVAGTYAVAINNAALDRSYVGTVNVTTSWQPLSITLSGDTSGTWSTGNTTGLQLTFDLGSGSNFNTTANAWQAGTYFRTSSCVTFVNQTAGSTLNITGVQLEVGNSATDFEYVNYQTSLANCQRYYYRTTAQTSGDRMGNGYIGSATGASVGFFYPVTMRTNPTALEQTGTATDYSVNWATSNTVCSAVPTFTTATTNFANVALTVASGLTTGQGCMARAATTSAYFGWSAEL